MKLVGLQILLIEDNDIDREAVVRALPGAAIREATCLADGLQALDETPFDCVLLDLNLPDAQHTEGLVRVSERHPGVPVVVLTGVEDGDLGVDLVHLGAQDYLAKGQISPIVLARSVRYAMERQRLHREIRISEKRYRSLMENAGTAIFVLSVEGRISETNRAGERLLGGDRARLVGRHFLDFVPPESRADAVALRETLLRDGSVAPGQIKCAGLDGVIRDVAFASSLFQDGPNVVSVASVTDITELRELHEQLVQSQKMEGIGRLAGGVAHDFNNILSVILTCARFLEEDLAESDPRREDVGEIASAAERAAGLTRQLLAFARRQPIAPQVVLVPDLIRNVHKLLVRTVGENIAIALEFEPDIWPTLVDPGQFEQVILNLAVNARDAMPDGGRITITAANGRSATPGGEQVVVRVTDTGVGIPAALQSQVFQPFFTTKEVGKGTGLGLATCYGLVRQAGGDIRFESTEGHGTSFEVRLPRSMSPEQPKAAPPGKRTVYGQGRVLVVEDEPLVARVATESLRRAGYDVITCSCAADALATVTKPDLRFDLLLTDVVMPGTNGKELARLIHQHDPNIRILFMTGYTDDTVVRHGVLEPGVELIYKPFYPETLVKKVREVLGQPS